MTAIPAMQGLGYPVVFDAGHQVRRYGIPSVEPSGNAPKEYIPILLRAGVAAGANGVFLETHPNPADALCDAGCQFDLTSCVGTCGDGALDPGESCDGSDFGEQTCSTAAGLASGDLGCTAACHLDVSGCFTCGDGAIEGPEQCDGFNLSGQDCLSQTGSPNGLLACDPVTCLFDTSDCH